MMIGDLMRYDYIFLLAERNNYPGFCSDYKIIHCNHCTVAYTTKLGVATYGALHIQKTNRQFKFNSKKQDKNRRGE